MMKIQCPNCGATIVFNKSDNYLWNMLADIRKVQRDHGKITTRAAAVRLAVSEATALRHLQKFEAAGLVKRIGQRAGWKVDVSDVSIQMSLLQ